MRRHAFAVPLLLALALAATACEDATEGQEIFQATLSGANEVPPRNSAGSGMAQFVVDGDRVHYSLLVDDMTNMLAAHIHTGAANVNGPVRVFLFSSVTPTTVSDQTIIGQGTFTAADVGAGITFADLLAAMRAGTTYVNVHTTQLPGGEIRGQIQRVN